MRVIQVSTIGEARAAFEQESEVTIIWLKSKSLRHVLVHRSSLATAEKVGGMFRLPMSLSIIQPWYLLITRRSIEQIVAVFKENELMQSDQQVEVWQSRV